MRRFLIKLLAMLVVIGALGVIAFAYFGDLSPDRQDQRVPVTLETE